jgi:chromosome partitioning protein
MLSRTLPRNRGRAAGQIYPHLAIEFSALPPGSHSRAGPCAAGQGLAGASFEHSKQNMVARNDLHEADIGAVREMRVALDTGSKPLHRRGFDVRHSQHHMRVAQRERAHFDVLTFDRQRKRRRLVEHRYAHVHRHQSVVSNARTHVAAGAAHDEIAAQLRRARIQQRRDTARAVAALLDLAAVGIKYSIEHPACGIARSLEQKGLVESHTGMAIREGAKRPLIKVSISGDGGGVEYQEIVAQPLHLQKLDAHTASIADAANFRSGVAQCWMKALPYGHNKVRGIMRHVMVLNAKGGCGKSTLSTNIAVFFARDGHNVCIADYDPQRSSLDWLATRPADLPAISGAAAFEDGLRSVPRNTDVLVIDAPARVHGTELNELVRRAETIIVPVLPSSIDMKACGHFMAELLEIGKVSRKQARLAVVANRVREHTLVFEELDQYLDKLKVPYLGVLREAQNYVRAYARGMGVLELPEYLASPDWQQWKPISEWLDSKRSQPSA